MAWISVNQSINALANQKYLVDTSSGGFSITLPEFASVGSYVIIADGADLSVNSVSVLTQTDFPFEDGNVFYIIDTAKTHFEFIFNGFNWLVYNVSREGLKVSDLPEQPSSQISNDDLFLYVNKDGSAAESTAIPYINLKQSIIDGVFTTAEQIVDALNDYDQIANLNVLTFDGQPSSFYLNYANLNNTPFIPTAVSQLSNDLGYITNLSSFTSDNLTEGQVNKYLTEPNFNALFEPAFSEAFRLFSGDFAEETVQDSLDNIQAFPLTTNNSTRFVNITNSALTDRFFPSKRIRIYGASRSPTVSIPTPVIGSAVGNGIFSGASGGNSVRYKVVQYNFLTGEFSASSNETSSIEGIDFESFNQINNISVTFSRTSSEFGVLIYRSVGSASFILIDVLGQKELGQSTQNIEYVDYGKFNFVPWSRKDLAAGNIYTPNTGTVHFPIFISSLNNPSKGWIDTTVLSVDTAANRIQLSEEAYFNPSLIISEDDTEQVQNAINLRINLGINSLSLNDRRYIISSLLLPSNFSFSGKGNATVLKKINWDFSSTNKMISASDTTPENISISNMSIDGNQQNQWLKSEAGDVYNNFAIDLKSENTNSTIERIKVSNIIGGGIATPRPAGFVLNLSKIEDSGMSDFFEYSPLIADDGSDIIVTTNSFKNFTSAIDISLSDNGVFTSNVVQNVGTGVLTFGSKFLISAPNIIRGPAGEFIPGPDVLNSVYDSINIKLEPGTSYVSDVYKYQENGIDFDISANRSSLELRVDKLRQVTNVEELYGEVLVAGDKPLQRVFDINLDETRGEFKFNISSSAVDALLDDFSFSTLKAIDTNHIGLTYNAVLTEFVPSGNIIAQSATGSSEYTVTLTNFSNISLGSRVRMLGHGGTPNLDNLIGTVININSTNANPTPPAIPELIVTIEYDQNITTAGSSGTITVENKLILAKGRIF
jgi:hypothetical protein